MFESPEKTQREEKPQVSSSCEEHLNEAAADAGNTILFEIPHYVVAVEECCLNCTVKRVSCAKGDVSLSKPSEADSDSGKILFLHNNADGITVFITVFTVHPCLW